MTQKKITSIINEIKDIHIFSIKKLESQNNQVFLINKKYIAKTTTKNKDYFDFLSIKLKNLKIKTPKILIIKNINSKLNLIIYELLNGKTFKNIKKIKPKTWQEIGACLKKIHSIRSINANKKDLTYLSKKNKNLFFNTFKKYRDIHKKLVPQIISKNDLKQTYIYLSDLQKLKKQQSTLLHGDYVLKNILLNKEKKVSGIIDFENSQFGDPLLELGFIYLWDGLMTNWNNVAKGYFSKDNLNKNKLINIKKYSIICAIILLSKNDLNKNQYKWIKKRFKKIIKELSL